ncbi:MAG: hypothetical protein IPK32_03790 [Verrucomicrobiaceae bacterium]|nr:hypothetical protein [Verrucomicrobiaceae bacterium]
MVGSGAFKMRQVLLPSHESYVLPTVKMLVRALERRGIPCSDSPLRHKPLRALAKIAGLCGLQKLPWSASKEPFFFHLNHVWPTAFFPYVITNPMVTFSFDCWPYLYDGWQRLFLKNQPRIAFVSAKSSVIEMRRRVPGVEFRWLPEALDPAGFNGAKPLAERDIDVLEIGRSYPAYHHLIRGPLESAGFHHDHPGTRANEMISYEDAVRAYANAKVVVCFPKSITAPEQAGGVETTTFRYFECMFSKALMIGHCPSELIDIMGYNPVIEVDMSRPHEQLIGDVLGSIEMFQSLVERNYDTVISRWTVDHQASIISSAMLEIAGGISFDYKNHFTSI